MIALLCTVAASAAVAQRTVRKVPARAPGPVTTPVVPQCQAMLGVGATTGLTYCDVLIGRGANDSITIALPPHRGPAELSFDLHNRHTFSRELVLSKKSFVRYTAIVHVVTEGGEDLGPAIVQNEFRVEADLVERIRGGASPDGFKAVAPTATEHITFEIPEKVNLIGIVGQRLTAERVEGTETFTQPGRPVATVSGIAVKYRAAPVRRSTKSRRSRKAGP